MRLFKPPKIEINSFEQAVEKLSWYCLRWGIEVYYKTLKSGCKIEERQLGNAAKIESCLAIDMVIAWRIYHLTKLGREIPDVPTVQLSPDGKTLMSILSLAMSMPMNTFFNTTFLSLRMRAFYAQATVRDDSAISSEDHAVKRSLLTKGVSISHPTPGVTSG